MKLAQHPTRVQVTRQVVSQRLLRSPGAEQQHGLSRTQACADLIAKVAARRGEHRTRVSVLPHQAAGTPGLGQLYCPVQIGSATTRTRFWLSIALQSCGWAPSRVCMNSCVARSRTGSTARDVASTDCVPVDGHMGSVEDSTPLLPGHEPSSNGRGKQWTDAQSDVLKRIQAAAANPTHKTYLWVGIGAGLCCGIVAYVYSTAFQGLLNLVWVRTWLPSASSDLQQGTAEQSAEL